MLRRPRSGKSPFPEMLSRKRAGVDAQQHFLQNAPMAKMATRPSCAKPRPDRPQALCAKSVFGKASCQSRRSLPLMLPVQTQPLCAITGVQESGHPATGTGRAGRSPALGWQALRVGNKGQVGAVTGQCVRQTGVFPYFARGLERAT